MTRSLLTVITALIYKYNLRWTDTLVIQQIVPYYRKLR